MSSVLTDFSNGLADAARPPARALCASMPASACRPAASPGPQTWSSRPITWSRATRASALACLTAAKPAPCWSAAIPPPTWPCSALGANLAPPTWLEDSDLRVGQLTLALGRPGRTVQATLGVISALGDGWRTGAGGLIDRYVQTDVVMYPGFSGGPLVDVTGRVAGLNSSALAAESASACPPPPCAASSRRCWPTARCGAATWGSAPSAFACPTPWLNRRARKPACWSTRWSRAARPRPAGLFLGDTILAVAGEPVRHHDDLLAKLSGDRVGAAVPFRILRGGQVVEISVVIGEGVGVGRRGK